MADLTTKQKVLGGVLGAAIFVAGGVTMALNLPVSSSSDSVAFEAQFQTASDFYDRFDYGYSGVSPYDHAGEDIFTLHGDHNLACGVPTTFRDVNILNGGGGVGSVDFSEMFWWCAPNGPDSGHVMTGVDTTGYNIAWFSPKPTFTAVSKVCWDSNATTMSRRKWQQVFFVGTADAARYPTGTPTVSGGQASVARGTGGFDLGYTNPDFRQTAPNTGIFPQGGTLAGFRLIDGSASWFQDQDFWGSQHVWPPSPLAGSDKATRYKLCLENVAGNKVRLTQQAPVGQFNPTGTLVREMTGQIPQGPVRVVFQDDNYDPLKDDRYSADVLTWHWDNVQVFTEGGSPPTTTTTVAPTATLPSTTTILSTTTSSTTTVPGSTTTTVPCPSTFNAEEQAWCQLVNGRLDALEN